MAKTVNLNSHASVGTRHNQNVERNLAYARSWYKTKEWHPNVRVRTSDAGSSTAGTIRKGVLNISFQADLGVIWSNRTIPVSTLDDETTFRNELNAAYEEVQGHAKAMERAKDEGKLKLSAPPKKPKGFHVSRIF